MINLKKCDYCPICGEHRRSKCNGDKINHEFFNYNKSTLYLYSFDSKNIVVQLIQNEFNFTLFYVRVSINFDEKIIKYEKSFHSIEDILNEYNKIIGNMVFE